MKIGIITDTHFGCRKNSEIFHDYFLRFYNNIFFPYLKQENITTVIDMGDTFDNPKNIDLSALYWAKRNYYDVLQEMGIQVHTLVGNHTRYYKNTNRINTIDLVLAEYKNIITYSEPTEIILDGLKVLLLPWITSENENHSQQAISNTDAKMCMGHLELAGFKLNRNLIHHEGKCPNIFNKFQKVFSGHYHTRSDDGKIFYLGNPYQMFTVDEKDERGFAVFDTETLDHFYVNNPYELFVSYYYKENGDINKINSIDFSGKFVTLVVKKKNDEKLFDKFLTDLYQKNMHDLKIIEDLYVKEEEIHEEDFQSEDTLALLNTHIDANDDLVLDKNKLKTILYSMYKEAYTE